jgi:hypothetical protein
MNEPKKDRKLGPAGWVALAVLAGLLAVSLWYAIHAWTALAGVAMSPAGWFYLILGALFTLALGAGLMALVFYSSRHDYDR